MAQHRRLRPPHARMPFAKNHVQHRELLSFGAPEKGMGMSDPVLLVEPSPWVASLMRSVLAPMRCRVILVQSMGQATSVLESRKPSLLLLSQHLPDGEAQDVVQTAYNIHVAGQPPGAKLMPVILTMTDCPYDGDESTDNLAPWMRAHGVVVVCKPIQIPRFEALVRRCLASSKANALDAIEMAQHRADAGASQKSHLAAGGPDARRNKLKNEVPWIDGDWGQSPPGPNRSTRWGASAP